MCVFSLKNSETATRLSNFLRISCFSYIENTFNNPIYSLSYPKYRNSHEIFQFCYVLKLFLVYNFLNVVFHIVYKL